MRDLVDGKEEVLVGGGSKDVADEPELPVEERGVAERVSKGNLERDDAENDPFREWFRATELGDLEFRD